MSDNLTESQRRLLQAMRREMDEVSAPIMAEVNALRKEQTERHEQGVKERLERAAKLKRHINGILYALGLIDKEK